MRWSIVRLIWLREMRDQLRDRRTMLMIFLLPLLIYPLGGLGLKQMASGLAERKAIIGVIGAENLPQAGAPVPGEKSAAPYPALLVASEKPDRFDPAYFDHRL